MCKAMEKRYAEKEVIGAIKGMRIAGMSDKDIIGKVVEVYHVTSEYVLAILASELV